MLALLWAGVAFLMVRDHADVMADSATERILITDTFHAGERVGETTASGPSAAERGFAAAIPRGAKRRAEAGRWLRCCAPTRHVQRLANRISAELSALTILTAAILDAVGSVLSPASPPRAHGNRASHRQGRSRGWHPRQVGIPRQYESRNPHADERHLGHDRAAALHELDEEQQRIPEVVRESGEALLAIVNDILDISKLEAGKLEMETVDFDLVNTVESAVALMSGKAREKNIDLGVFVEPAARGTYRGDPARLRQVLLNLLNNAVKFTDKGGVSIQVHVSRAEDIAAEEGTVPLRFQVVDTGIGMPESVRQRLFQKFSQVDSSVTRRYGGTGLGLAICKELIELMGGRIGVQSRVGVGSTFWFELALPRAEATIVNHDRLPEQLRALKALVVDDVAMNLEILGRQLASLGHGAQHRQ